MTKHITEYLPEAPLHIDIN